MKWTRGIRSVAVAVLMTGMLMVAAPRAASACSCALSPLTERLAAADIQFVFTGTATRGEVPSGPVISSEDLETWTFAVDAVHKGAPSRTTVVGTPLSDGSCGVDFVVDQRYLVLTRAGADGVPTAMLCDGSTSLDSLSADDRALLGPGTPPSPDVASRSGAAPGGAAPGGAGPGETSVWSSAVSWAVAAVLGLAVACVVVIAVRRRKA